MEQIRNVAIGGKSFVISEDAYKMLDKYLTLFKCRIEPASEADDVMVEIEERIAELFCEAVRYPKSVVDTEIVSRVIKQLGMPDGSSPEGFSEGAADKTESSPHRYYRDADGRIFAGVCSGLALYFNVDVMLVRILAVILLFCGGIGFWAYIILWLVCPEARTPLQKCELRGLRPSAENLRNFSNKK